MKTKGEKNIFMSPAIVIFFNFRCVALLYDNNSIQYIHVIQNLVTSQF